MTVPPEMLMGEAGICGFWAMVAVSYVYQRNQKMNGWDRNFSSEALLAAILWPILPDTSNGAHYVFSSSDLMRPPVLRIIKATGPPKQIIDCEVGKLYFF